MLEKKIYDWLLKKYNPSTANARKANCLNVSSYEGELDEHFEKDACRSLLEKLSYSTDDENHNRPAKHKIPINGNVKNGTATLKQAVNLYVEFRNETKNNTKEKKPKVEAVVKPKVEKVVEKPKVEAPAKPKVEKVAEKPKVEAPAKPKVEEMAVAKKEKLIEKVKKLREEMEKNSRLMNSLNAAKKYKEIDSLFKKNEKLYEKLIILKLEYDKM